jgi:hypothetical protein
MGSSVRETPLDRCLRRYTAKNYRPCSAQPLSQLSRGGVGDWLSGAAEDRVVGLGHGDCRSATARGGVVGDEGAVGQPLDRPLRVARAVRKVCEAGSSCG